MDVEDENTQAADEVDDSHNGNELLGNGREALHAAQEDEAGEEDDEQAHDPGGDAKGRIAGRGNRIGLDHAAHEAKCQDDGNGEEAREELAARTREGLGDVVDRTAMNGAVLVDLARLLREDGLGVVGRHTEERDEPHPEDGARAADQDGAAGTHDVARADLRRDGGGERLKRADAALLLAAEEVELTEDAAHALSEEANLHELGADGEHQAHGNEQDDEHVVRQIGVDGYDDVV